MLKSLSLFALALALIFSTGCMFSKKARAARETTITSEVEGNLQRRWVERRAAELVAQGTAAEAAQAQAQREFAEKFAFTGAAKK